MTGKTINVSVRGTSHKKRDMPCQDAGRVEFTRQGILIVAVADGAGSARHSAMGASIAVDAAMIRLAERFPAEELSGTEHDIHESLLEIAGETRQQVIDEAQKLGAETGHLACTLILCVASRTRMAVFHIGDGAVVIRMADGGLQTLSAPVNGEYFNETNFLTDDIFDDGGRFSSCSGVLQDIAVITDGLELTAIDIKTHAPFAPFFNPLMDFFRDAESDDFARTHIEALLQSPRVCERTNDDLTLILASWMTGPML